MTIIIKTGDYTLHTAVTRVERPVGHFHVKFTEQLNTAKRPDEHRTVYQFTGSGEALRALAVLSRWLSLWNTSSRYWRLLHYLRPPILILQNLYYHSEQSKNMLLH